MKLVQSEVLTRLRKCETGGACRIAELLVLTFALSSTLLLSPRLVSLHLRRVLLFSLL